MEVRGSSREQMENIDEVSLDINNLANSLRDKLNILGPLSSGCCIYRVPPRIRELNEKAYTPRVVSIGPFHRGKEELKAMEEHKMRCLKDFLVWSKVSLEVLIKVVRESEKKLRNCYAETINLSSEEFVEMMVLDAVFIIRSLLAPIFGFLGSSWDLVPMRSDIGYDMCLLENQLPFFILVDLLEQSSKVHDISTIQLAIQFLYRTFGFWQTSEALAKINSPRQVAHFVDLLRLWLQPSDQLEPRELLKVGNQTIPSVTQLHRAGVKFVSSSNNLLAIKFNKGILEIPNLQIGDGDNILYRNVLAYEQCHSPPNYMISGYLFFINSLVNDAKDVEILVKHGILEHFVSNNEAVSNLFTNLTTGASISPNSYILALAEDLNAYCRRPWNMWKANLKQDYFYTPWTAISVIAAVILLILTVIQSVCSVIQVT